MDTIPPLPQNRDEWPPAAYGAGAPAESFATYTKLRNGDWGLRIPGGATAGQTVVVRKRDGRTHEERVGRIVWTGTDRNGSGTVAIATIGGRFQPQPQRSAPPQPAAKPASKPKAKRSKRQPIPVIPRLAGVEGRRAYPFSMGDTEREALNDDAAKAASVFAPRDERDDDGNALPEPLF